MHHSSPKKAGGFYNRIMPLYPPKVRTHSERFSRSLDAFSCVPQLHESALLKKQTAAL